MDTIEKDGIKFYPLYCSCPVCLNRGNQTPHYYWHHGNNCGGQILIGNNGKFLCSKCYATSDMRNWKIFPDCENNHKNNEIIESSDQVADLATYLAFIAQMIQTTGIAWIQECLTNVQKIEKD